MKILGITAGRHGGNSEIILKEALLTCQKAGCDVVMVNLYDYDIKSCLGCSMCGGNETAAAALDAGTKGGCLWDGKDDMKKIMEHYLEADGIIISVPTYDLMPSGLYLKFANRTITYEAGFLRMKGIELKARVAGIISVGGSTRSWQSMALEGLAATLFTQSIFIADQYLCDSCTLKGQVLLRDDHIKRAHTLAENVMKSAQTPPEERRWLGEEDFGWCPICHSNSLSRGEKHWDGVYWPVECQVCGAGGDIVKDEEGNNRFVIAEDGLLKCRIFEKSRDKHFEEVMHNHMKTQIPENKEFIKEEIKRYAQIKFDRP